MRKTIKAALMAAVLIFCIFVSGCSKSKSGYTAETYYTYEDQFRAAGYSKRTSKMYVAGEGKYDTSEELKEAAGEPEITGVVEWEGKENKMTSYNLDAEGNKIGAVTYTCRYSDAKKRIARIGNGTYTEYTYENGQISRITRYNGEKKTADAEAVMTIVFKYDADRVNTVVSIEDNTEGTHLSYDYKLSYDDSGRLVRIVYISENGEQESCTDFGYNNKGLIISSSRYGKDNKLLVYTEYTYE